MRRNKLFRTRIFGDIDLSGMAVEILFDEFLIATVMYEKGTENMEIEIYPSITKANNGTFFLNEFQAILEEAKKRAIQCAKEDEENPI